MLVYIFWGSNAVAPTVGGLFFSFAEASDLGMLNLTHVRTIKVLWHCCLDFNLTAILCARADAKQFDVMQ